MKTTVYDPADYIKTRNDVSPRTLSRWLNHWLKPASPVTKTVTTTPSKHLIIIVQHDTILFINIHVIPYGVKNYVHCDAFWYTTAHNPDSGC